MKNQLIIAFCFCSFFVYADDGYFGGSGDTVQPLYQTQIEMISQDVVIMNKQTQWEVECFYKFYNAGKETEIQMGFPDKIKEGDYNQDIEEDRYTIKQFETYINEKRIELKIKKGLENPQIPGIKYDKIYSYLVNFKKGEEKTIRHKYLIDYSGDSTGHAFLTYILKTGSLWKGKIRKAKVVISNVDTNFIVEIKPTGFKFEKDRILWEWTNLEPDEDIYIVWHSLSSQWLNDSEHFIRNNLKKDFTGKDEDMLNDILDAGIYNFNYWIHPGEELSGVINNNPGLRKKIADVMLEILEKHPYYRKDYYSDSCTIREGDLINNPRPYIRLVMQSGTSINESSIEMLIDGNPVTPNISFLNNKNIFISYSPVFDLTDGEHETYIYGKNELGLEDGLRIKFRINTALETKILRKKLPTSILISKYLEIIYILSGQKERLEKLYMDYLENFEETFIRDNDVPEPGIKVLELRQVARRSIIYSGSYYPAIKAYQIIFNKYKNHIREDMVATIGGEYAEACIALNNYSKAIDIYKNIPLGSSENIILGDIESRHEKNIFFSTQSLIRNAKKLEDSDAENCLKLYRAAFDLSITGEKMESFQIYSLTGIANIYEKTNKPSEAIKIYQNILDSYEPAFYWSQKTTREKLSILKTQQDETLK